MKGGYRIELDHDGEGWFWRLLRNERPICVGAVPRDTPEMAQMDAMMELHIFAGHAGSSERHQDTVDTIPCGVVGEEKAA